MRSKEVLYEVCCGWRKFLDSDMVDRLSPAHRSWLMSRVRSKNTGPELAVRRALHAQGYRFRVHNEALPGKPDMVFSRRRKVIFVHGCFWHGHACRGGGPAAKTNEEYWHEKIARNRARDRRTAAALRREGWGVAVIWECQIKRGNWISRVNRFLGPPRTPARGTRNPQPATLLDEAFKQR